MSFFIKSSKISLNCILPTELQYPHVILIACFSESIVTRNDLLLHLLHGISGIVFIILNFSLLSNFFLPCDCYYFFLNVESIVNVDTIPPLELNSIVIINFFGL